jgi:methyl-accepting chemotaxis protein
LSGQQLLFVALSFAVIVLSVVLAVTLLQLRRTIRQLESRLESTLRQAEMTAEDLRRTNATVREILVHVERVAANVALVSEGGKKVRRSLDMASAGIAGIVLPVIGGVSGVTAGAKAFIESLVNRHSRKEEEDHV